MRNFLILLICISIYYLFISKAERSKNVIPVKESEVIIKQEKNNYYSFSNQQLLAIFPLLNLIQE